MFNSQGGSGMGNHLKIENCVLNIEYYMSFLLQ